MRNREIKGVWFDLGKIFFQYVAENTHCEEMSQRARTSFRAGTRAGVYFINNFYVPQVASKYLQNILANSVVFHSYERTEAIGDAL